MFFMGGVEMSFNNYKKLMVFFLSILLSASLLPITVSAYEEPAKTPALEKADEIKDSDEMVNFDNSKNRILSLLKNFFCR